MTLLRTTLEMTPLAGESAPTPPTSPDTPVMKQAGEGELAAGQEQMGGKDGTQEPVKEAEFPWLMVVIVVVIWAWFFRSMKKQKSKQKERQNELGGLKKGDAVMTIGGIYGVIQAIDDETMTLVVDKKNGSTMKFVRSALSKVLTKDGEKNDEKKDESAS